MNQSMVQQLIREGNILILALKASPIGLKAKTTWRFRLTRSMNMLYILRSGLGQYNGQKKKRTQQKTNDPQNTT
jgi:hypothetical protein